MIVQRIPEKVITSFLSSAQYFVHITIYPLKDDPNSVRRRLESDHIQTPNKTIPFFSLKNNIGEKRGLSGLFLNLQQ